MRKSPEWQQERKRLRIALTHCLGLIVEFGDLNGFRNMTDQELGSSIQAVAKEAAEALSSGPADAHSLRTEITDRG